MTETHRILIIGAGLSGLSVAHFLAGAGNADLLILEQADRPGGAIRSFREKGFLAEWGPHGFLDNNPASKTLLAETGLDAVALKAPLGNFLRFVCHNGRLVPLPQNPKALLTTPLLTARGKLRLLGDLWKKPRREEQSIARWAEYRFGPEVLPLVDAAATGTFAGDCERLSMDAVMPGVRRLEQEAGSVLKGVLARKGKKEGGRTLPAMTSFPEGMEQIITTLAARARVAYNSPVLEIRRNGTTWEAQTESACHRAETLVLALPVNRALQLLKAHEPPMPAVPTASIATVAMGFGPEATVPYGFGYLAPEREKRFTLGALFSTRMFPGRAPEGMQLLEALVGGRRHPERLELDDQELVARIYDDMKALLNLPAPPAFHRVLRSDSAIPQLEMGYPALLAWKESLEQRMDGLHICGFGWEGIGMNDMMKAAAAVAGRIRSRERGDAERPEVRPVYF